MPTIEKFEELINKIREKGAMTRRAYRKIERQIRGLSENQKLYEFETIRRFGQMHKAYIRELVAIKDAIESNADDVVWFDDITTVVDHIDSIINDKLVNGTRRIEQITLSFPEDEED